MSEVFGLIVLASLSKSAERLQRKTAVKLVFLRQAGCQCVQCCFWFQGYIPAFVRLGPHTVLTWVFLEQMRLNFGYLKDKDVK